MKKVRLLAFLCAFVLGFSLLAGCDGGLGKESVEMFSAPATVKVMKDIDFKDKGEKHLKVSMAKNEYESVQLILRSASDFSYDVAVTDLMGANGTKIAKENIQLFNQHYIETIKRSSNTAVAGWYPEALIPFNKAKEAGENKAKANENQGIWVKIKTDKTTAAGIYNGSLDVTIGKRKESVPLTVTVWNFAVPDEANTRSAFLTYQDSIVQGEGDNTDAMMEAYYEFFLENRITTSNLPGKAGDDETLLKMLKKYYAHPKMTGYAIPYVQQLNQGVEDVNYEKLKSTIKKIVALSIEDNVNYMEKAYLYITLIDEFDQTHNFAGRDKRALEIGRNIINMKNDIVKELEAENSNFFKGSELKAALRHDILTLTDLAVAQPRGFNEHVPLFDTWAIPAIYIDSKDNRAFYDEVLRGEDREVWWYTCVGPVNPYVSYHIDDNLIGARVMSWMQKDYNLQGNLYWSTAAYVDRVDGGYERPTDPYTEPIRFASGTVNGDGYLVYPGAKYGVKGPVGSLRTEAIRDGQEDYEYLYLLEEKYEELSEYYGHKIDFDSAMRSIYDTIYTGAVPYLSTKNFADARETVAQLLADSTSLTKLIIEKTENTPKGVQVDLLLSGDIKNVTFNGAEVNGVKNNEGNKFTFELPYSDDNMNLKFTYLLNGKTETFDRFISSGTNRFFTVNEENISRIAVSVTSATPTYIDSYESVPNVYKLVLKSVITGDAVEDARFNPGVAFDPTFMGEKRKDVQSISIKVFNPTDSEMKASLKLWSFIITANEIALVPGWNTIELNNIKDFDKVTAVQLAFKNQGTSDNPSIYEIYVADIMYKLVKK